MCVKSLLLGTKIDFFFIQRMIFINILSSINYFFVPLQKE